MVSTAVRSFTAKIPSGLIALFNQVRDNYPGLLPSVASDYVLIVNWLMIILQGP